MPRNGAGVYSLPPGTAAASGELATAEQFNDRFDDVATDLNFLSGQIAIAMPIGGIIMWSGAVSAVPSGWALCNGSNGTPDLRDRFIVGAGTTYAVAATGGAATVTLTAAQLPSHAHAAGTLQAASGGAHTHALSGNTDTTQVRGSLPIRRREAGNTSILVGASTGALSYAESAGGGSVGRVEAGNNNSPADLILLTADHSHSLAGATAASGGAHTHNLTGTSGSVGSGEAHENRPPYYALAFIMRVT
jgi:microcystin-dependent protein